MVSGKTVFLAGATGYMGRALVPKLVHRGHRVHALVRPASTAKLEAGCIPVLGDALNSETFTAQIPEHCTYVHLVGTPRPAPWKEKQFRAIDLPSVKASVAAAVTAKVSHFIYVRRRASGAGYESVYSGPYRSRGDNSHRESSRNHFEAVVCHRPVALVAGGIAAIL